MRLSFLVVGLGFLAGCTLAEPPPPPEIRNSKPPPTPPVATGGAHPSTGTCAEKPTGFVEQGPVVEPAKPPPAISGGTLTTMPDGTLVAADSDRDVVYLVDADLAVRTVALAPQDEPGRVTAGPAGRAFVALRRAGKIAELDLATGTVRARHAACGAPRGLAWSESKQQLAVACASGELVRLTFTDAALTNTAVAHPADDLRDVAFDGDRLLLSTFRDAKLLALSAEGTVAPQPSPGTRASLAPNSAYRLHTPRVAWRTVAMPNGTYMVHQRAQDTSLTSANVQGCNTTPYGSSSNGIDTLGVLHSVVTKVSNGQATEVVSLRDAVLPVDLAVASDESSLVLASPGSGVHLVKGGTSALLLTVTPAAQFTAVTYRNGNVVAFSREPAMLYILEPKIGAPVTTVSLSSVSVKSTGHELFHRATANQIACASCHPEGGEDGHVWLLPEGLRRTPSLRGGLSGTEPFHWAGDQSSMTELLSDVLVRRMGGAAQSPERAKASIAWLDTLPKLPAPPLDAEAVARGRALFASPTTGCASCHGGELGTNNASAEVGTGGLVQVPRLVELAYRAPFFHDGRVSSLADRFGPKGGGDAHGFVSQLTAQQQADLVTYMKSR